MTAGLQGHTLNECQEPRAGGMRAVWERPSACVSEGSELRVERGPDVLLATSPHLPFPPRLQLVPALDGCLRRGNWLDPQAQTSGSAPTSSLRSCTVQSQPGTFFPPGTRAEFNLQGKGCFSFMASSVSAVPCLPPALAASLHESPALSPQGDHVSSLPKASPSLMQNPGPSLWTWDSSWQQALATSLPLGPQKTLLSSASTSKIK